jgi:FixJ family two-component response regulator
MLNLNPTVFVVDPDPSFRGALEPAIRRAGCSPESFASVDLFLARPRVQVPTCLLLGIGRPDGDGLDPLRRITSDRKETPIIVMSGLGDVPMTVQAMRAGAFEFLMKPLAERALLEAVSNAIAASHAVLQQETGLLDLERRRDSLSAREREVLSLVTAGYLNKQIGTALGISEVTVKAHRGRMMQKMGAGSLAELVSMAIRLRLPMPITRTLAPRPNRFLTPSVPRRPMMAEAVGW